MPYGDANNIQLLVLYFMVLVYDSVCMQFEFFSLSVIEQSFTCQGIVDPNSDRVIRTEFHHPPHFNSKFKQIGGSASSSSINLLVFCFLFFRYVCEFSVENYNLHSNTTSKCIRHHQITVYFRIFVIFIIFYYTPIQC